AVAVGVAVAVTAFVLIGIAVEVVMEPVVGDLVAGIAAEGIPAGVGEVIGSIEEERRGIQQPALRRRKRPTLLRQTELRIVAVGDRPGAVAGVADLEGEGNGVRQSQRIVGDVAAGIGYGAELRERHVPIKRRVVLQPYQEVAGVVGVVGADTGMP